MRWLISSDIHISPKGGEEYRWLVFEEIRKVIKKEAVTTLILAGDYTDFKDNHPSSLVNRFCSEIKKLAKRVPVYILGGNHDTVAEVGYHFFSFLDNYKNVTFISTPQNIEIDGKNVFFLPHARNPYETWKNLSFAKCDYIFMHQTVVGSKTSDQFTMSSGLGTDIFSDTTAKIYSGDVHVPQTVGPVEYIGAPIRLRYGDTYTPQMILESENESEIIEMVHLPMKHKVTISSFADFRKQDIAYGDMVKVVVTLPELEFDTYSDMRSMITEYAKKNGIVLAGIELIRKTRVRLLSRQERVCSTKENNTSSMHVIRRFADKEKLGAGLVTTASNILKQVDGVV